MRRLEAYPAEGFNQTDIDVPVKFDLVTHDGRTLDYEKVIGNTPAVTSSYDAISSPQMVLSREGSVPLWDREDHYDVGRLNKNHGRNLEVLADSVHIQDEFGNDFYSLCIKGSDFTNPHFMESATAVRDFIVHGLQESLVIERVIRASKLLRENHIDTEYICGLVVPEQFPVSDSSYGIDSVSQKPLPEFLEILATKHASESRNDKSPIEAKAEMLDKFKDCDYLVTYRAMECRWRLGELTSSSSIKKVKDFLLQNDINMGAEDEQYLEDIDDGKFFRSLVAGTAAVNVARLHKLGLIHGFPHADNFTATGGLVDLDSVRGPALGLGDEVIKDQEYIDELFYVCRSFTDTHRSYFEREVVVPSGQFYSREDRGQLDKERFELFANIVYNYVLERFDDDIERAEFLKKIIVQKAENFNEDDTGFLGGRSMKAISVVAVSLWERYFKESQDTLKGDISLDASVMAIEKGVHDDLATTELANYPVEHLDFIASGEFASLPPEQQRLTKLFIDTVNNSCTRGFIGQIASQPLDHFMAYLSAYFKDEDIVTDHRGELPEDFNNIETSQVRNLVGLFVHGRFAEELQKRQKSAMDYPHAINEPYGITLGSDRSYPLIYTKMDESLYEKYGLDPDMIVPVVANFYDAIYEMYDPNEHTVEFLADETILERLKKTDPSIINRQTAISVVRDKQANIVDATMILVTDPEIKFRNEAETIQQFLDAIKQGKSQNDMNNTPELWYTE